MRDQYKKIANWYDMIFEPLNSGLRKIGMKLYPPKDGMNVLDIGCGTGAHLKLYQDESCNVFGIDMSAAMLKVARTKLGDSADLRLGNASKTTYSENKFDIIIVSTVLHEMDHQARINVIKEVKRILKKDGRVLLIDFHSGTTKNMKGLFSKVIITISEIVAGRTHYKNYRNFMKNGCLPNLITSTRLIIEDYKIVSGGNFGIYLLKLA